MNGENNLEKLRRIAYRTDASGIIRKPKEVFLPSNLEQIRDRVLFGRNIVIRGGGSSLVGGSIANDFDSLIIDLSKMNRILSLDISRKQVLVEAGIILDELNEFLEDYNLEFPVHPISEKICTIGGMIASNAGGSRELKYGRTGNLVEEVELINGRGELIKLRKADLSDVVGLEGITGIIVKARLKLVEKKQKAFFLYSLNNLEEVVELAKKLRLVKNATMIEFFDKTISSLIGLNENYHIILELEESENNNIVGKRSYQEIQKLRNKVYPSLAKLGYVILEDPKVFLDKFLDLANYLELNKVPYFASLGSGVIHPVFSKQDREKNLITNMLEYVRKLHGKITGKFGIGRKKREYFDNIEKKIIDRLKNRYDPGFKINLGVLIEKPIINQQEVKMEEDKIEVVKDKESEELQEKAEANIEATKQALSEDLKHDEEIGENKTEDNLSELSKDEE